MDPNATLSEARFLALSIMDANDSDDGDSIDVVDASRLAELFLALDTWMSSYGFPPREWSDASKEATQ